jgi:RNA polymerase sigma-70 factor (ECF subfamily)
MRHLDGLEIGEIAALTGSTPEAVRVNLSRARKRVRELFMKEERR